MNRREALAALSTVLGGTIIGAQAFLSGCATPTPASTEPAFVGMLGEADVALLNEIGETILPTTPGSPGAGAANVGAFMNVMVTDCYSPEEQQIFQAGLPALAAAVQEQYGQDFASLTAEQKHEFVLGLEAEARHYATTRLPEDPEIHYYSMIKQMTLLGYFTSEAGQTKALRYVAVPGRYEGCVPLEEGQRAWA